MSQDAVDVGSVEVTTIVTSSAHSAIVLTASVPIAKAVPTDPCNACLKGSPYHHPLHAPSQKHWHMSSMYPPGVASAYATILGMKKSTAPHGSCAATAAGEETSISFVHTSVTTPMTNSCMARSTRYQILASMVMARVEVKPTSILNGG